MDRHLTGESLERCRSALSYIEDMSEWYDEDLEGAPKVDFARRILDQIDRRDNLSREERAYCEAQILAKYDRGLETRDL